MWIELFCGVTAIAFVLMVKWVGDLENEIRNLKICKANIKHVDATIRQAHSSACELLENERKARKEENEKINEAIIAEVMERNRLLANSWIACDKETKKEIDTLHDSLFVKDAFGQR